MNDNDAIARILSNVDSLAPKAWDMIIRTQRLEAVVDGGTAMFFLALLCFGYRLIWAKSAGHPDRTEYRWLAGFVGVFGASLCLSALVNSFVQYTSPDLYAVHQMLTHK